MYQTQRLHRSLQRHPDKPALRHVGAGDVRDHTFAELQSDIARHAAAPQTAVWARVTAWPDRHHWLVSLLPSLASERFPTKPIQWVLPFPPEGSFEPV